ncbi:hypothetical protein AB0D30_21075 [Streptomyces sp. NPDC048409]|uniref:hypothetical protein n=1 Tax=Streptomyces sp. NPDC048409 TaxID=3154723 RepID=UPI00342A350C
MTDHYETLNCAVSAYCSGADWRDGKPLSAAGASLAKGTASVVTKHLQSKAGVRLGSRDERRLVYRRFQDAVTEAYTMLKAAYVEQGFFTVYLGKRRFEWTLRPIAYEGAARAALPVIQQSGSELLQAYMDLRLTANRADSGGGHRPRPMGGRSGPGCERAAGSA